MGYLLIFLYSLSGVLESVIVRLYGKRRSEGGMMMNAVVSLFAVAFFALTDQGGFNVPVEMIPLAVINAILYAVGFYLTFLAFKIGPYGLTRLILNFALMMPIAYGIFFINEPTTPLTYIGIVMILVAMPLINYAKRDDTAEDDSSKPSVKWLIYILISTVANGFISILTRMQQIRFENSCSNEFQMISIGGSFVILAIISLITEKETLKNSIKSDLIYGAGAGLFVGAKNIIILFIYLFLPISVVSPMNAGVSMALSFIVSLLVYRERYSARQMIGVLLGVAAIVILAL